MFTGSGWCPSRAARPGYDAEARLASCEGEVSRSNSLYDTEAERFDVVAPFLAKALAKDRPRRNYVIEPGGRAIYYGARPAPADPWAGVRVEYPAALDQLGHDTQDLLHETPGRVPRRT